MLRFSGAGVSDVGLGHVGDSRAYHLRGDVLCQVSDDHTYVQHLVDTGRLTQSAASISSSLT